MITRCLPPVVARCLPPVVAQCLPAIDVWLDSSGDLTLEERMERLHMNYLRDLIHRLRAGESERRIARDLGISRPTVHKYHQLARMHGFLDAGSVLPDDARLAAVLGEAPHPPRAPSSVEPYAEVVQRLLDQQVEMTAIFQRLCDGYGYPGS